jgi:hypothetical protein
MTDVLECVPFIYLLVAYFTSLKFDMNIFLIFCGVAAVFAILDIFKIIAKRRVRK